MLTYLSNDQVWLILWHSAEERHRIVRAWITKVRKRTGQAAGGKRATLASWGVNEAIILIRLKWAEKKQQVLLSSEDCWQQEAKCHAVHAEERSLGWGGSSGQQTNVLTHFGFTGSMKFLGEASFNRDDVSELFKLCMCLKLIKYWLKKENRVHVCKKLCLIVG